MTRIVDTEARLQAIVDKLAGAPPEILPPPRGVLFEGEDVPVLSLRYVPLDESALPLAQVDLCALWLFEALAAAGEPIRPATLVRAAKEDGFSRSTLYRGRRALGGWVVDVGTGPFDPFKRWTLVEVPHSDPPSEASPDSTPGACPVAPVPRRQSGAGPAGTGIVKW